MQDRRPAVVVLRALGLGDLLTAIPALRALADAFPRHPRLLAAPAELAPLARASGAVDEVVPAEGLAEPLHRRLHGAGLAVNLHGRGPESHDLLAATEPRRLVAFAHPAVPASSQGPRWRPDEHEVARWCRLLEESGIAADPGRLDLELPPGPVPHGAGGRHPGPPGRGQPVAALAARTVRRGRQGRAGRRPVGDRDRRPGRGRPGQRRRRPGRAAPERRPRRPGRRPHHRPPGRRRRPGRVRRHRRRPPGHRPAHPVGGAVRPHLPRPLGAAPRPALAPRPCGPATAATRTASSPTPACWPSTSTRSPRPWPTSRPRPPRAPRGSATARGRVA